MSEASRPPQRLLSLDALRGFDMFWIMGGDALAGALHQVGNDPVTGTLADQLEHVEWAGFHFYDLIFPLFVFIVGVSLVFSLAGAIEQHGRAAAIRRVLFRSLLMFVVALFYSGGFTAHWPDIRLFGVLNRIALCYAAGGLLFCLVRERWAWIAGTAAALLLGYWALMSFVPFPDLRRVDETGALLSPSLDITNASGTAQLNWDTTNSVRGTFNPGLNLANYVDQKFLPGKKWEKTWDPEGLLSTLPAMATCLLGMLAGLLLKNPLIADRRKVTLLLAVGAVAVVAGFAWSTQFPVIKKIWTSSFVLVAGGYSAMLLAVFYLVIDVWQWRKWCVVFVWYGMNPITVYLADNIISFRRVATRFLGGDVQAFLNTRVTFGFGDLLLAFGEIAVGICLVWFLYRRKIFLRL